MKYEVTITNGSTGSHTEENVPTIDKVIREIEEARSDSNLTITVYDNELNEFIYYKWCRESKPDTDLIWNRERDLRTTTRKIKELIHE